MTDRISTIKAQGFSGPVALRERHVLVQSFNEKHQFDGYALKEVQIDTTLFSQESLDKLVEMLEIIRPCLKP